MEIKYDSLEVQEALDKIVDAVDNANLWRMIGIDAELAVDQNFEVQGQYQTSDNPVGGSQKWVPRQQDYPWPVLSKSLALRNSIYSEVTDNQSVVIGSKGLPYNRAHQYGYNNLPARPYLNISPDALQKIMERIEATIEDAFND